MCDLVANIWHLFIFKELVKAVSHIFVSWILKVRAKSVF